MAPEGSTVVRSGSQRRILVLASAAVPMLLLATLIYLLVARGTGIDLAAPTPIEKLAFERVVLRPGEFVVHVLNTGPEPVNVEQVQVGWLNRASWEFHSTPSGPLPRLGRAVIRIPYPWIAGEPYEIALISKSGLVFSHEIQVANETPTPGPSTLGTFALLGVYVGVIPVFLGIGWLPFLRALPRHWYFFLLSLTVGLLLFLGIDSLEEALEAAALVPEPYQGSAIVVIGFLLTILGLYAVSGRLNRGMAAEGRASTPLLLAYSVAFGIGIHNFGEGLAISGAYSLGEVAVGTLLVMGFTVHNLTEGVAIVAPVVQSRLRWTHLLWLGLIAGMPTIAGTLLGAIAYTPVWSVLFLAIGAGAITQVIIEITRYQIQTTSVGTLVGGRSLAGLVLGLGLMYLTAMLVAA
jgi:zinc transporter, ZIP family